MEDAPVQSVSDDLKRVCHELDDVVPEDPNMPYDIRDIIEPVCDQQYFFEIQPQFAQNIVIGFGRLAGRTVGFVANQPNHLAGALDIDASDKAARLSGSWAVWLTKNFFLVLLPQESACAVPGIVHV